MSRRFYVGKGRYSSLRATHYMNFTYGRDSFGQHEVQPNEQLTHGSYGALLFDKRWVAGTDLIDDLKKVTNSYDGIKEYCMTFINHGLVSKDYPHERCT